MAGQQPARGGAGENINDFMARRRREGAERAPRARAAHEAYGKALRKTRGFHVGHPGFAESLDNRQDVRHFRADGHGAHPLPARSQ